MMRACGSTHVSLGTPFGAEEDSISVRFQAKGVDEEVLYWTSSTKIVTPMAPI